MGICAHFMYKGVNVLRLQLYKKKNTFFFISLGPQEISRQPLQCAELSTYRSYLQKTSAPASTSHSSPFSIPRAPLGMNKTSGWKVTICIKIDKFFFSFWKEKELCVTGRSCSIKARAVRIITDTEHPNQRSLLVRQSSVFASCKGLISFVGCDGLKSHPRMASSTEAKLLALWFGQYPLRDLKYWNQTLRKQRGPQCSIGFRALVSMF